MLCLHGSDFDAFEGELQQGLIHVREIKEENLVSDEALILKERQF